MPARHLPPRPPAAPPATPGLPTPGLPTLGLPTPGLPTPGLPTLGLPTIGLLTLGLMSLGLLAGCTKPDTFAPACPQARLLPDAADLTRFNGRGEDVADLTLNGRLTAVRAECSDAGSGMVRARMLGVVMDLTRGPALAGRQVRVPLFIAVVENGQVLSEKDYQVNVAFPSNVDTINVTEDTDGTEILLPVTPQKSAAAYTLFVAFRLTPQELEYNRRRVRR